MAGGTPDQGSETQTGRTRVKAACERCRRQKLRCDQERPCALCIRSNAQCITEPGNPGGIKSAGVPASKDGRGPLPPTVTSTNIGTKKRKHASSVNILPQFRSDTRETSTVQLTQEILRDSAFEPAILENQTFALPGGSNPDTQFSPSTEQDPTIRDLIGIDFPDKKTADFLVESYFTSVHWFMMVLHEPSFRAYYEEMIVSRKAPRSHLRKVALTMVVLAIGARYATKAALNAAGLKVDLDSLQSILLSKVQENMITILDDGELECVQICILLSSFYLYHGKPNLGFIVLGTGARCAQAINLHREETWRKSTAIVREQRKRVWWALYVFDRFASIIFGRPCCLKDSESSVSIVQNMGDTTSTHPFLNSMETLEDGTLDYVTIFSYQRHKFMLYKIASPIIGDLYFHQSSTLPEMSKKIKGIHEELVGWFAELPPELLLSDRSRKNDRAKSSVETIFELQALALQLAYDNIQILLHRPFLSYNGQGQRPFARSHIPSHVQRASPSLDEIPSDTSTPTGSQDYFSTSKRQCWESALRTSQLFNYKDCLLAATDTHAVSYLGIHLFTAGIILSIVALSKPLSSQAQEAKQAIGHILHMLECLEDRILLSRQSGKILEELVRQILLKEMGVIMPHNKNAARLFHRSSNRMVDSSRMGAGTSPMAEHDVIGNLVQSQDHGPKRILGPSPGSEAYIVEGRHTADTSGLYFQDPMLFGHVTLENTDFQEGITDVQQSMFSQSEMMNTGYTEHDGTFNHTSHSALIGENYTVGNITGGFPGQAWLWEPPYT